MSVFDELIKVNEDGLIFYSGWIEWQHIPIGFMHCPICLALNDCWFADINKPDNELHDKCHCVCKPIANPIANVNCYGKCDLRKFTDYIFSDKYAWNGKRDLFAILGFDKNDSKYLQYEFEKQAVNEYCNGNYSLGKLDAQGQRINIDVKFEKNGRQIVFNSGWMVRPKGLITNNTPLAD